MAADGRDTSWRNYQRSRRTDCERWSSTRIDHRSQDVGGEKSRGATACRSGHQCAVIDEIELRVVSRHVVDGVIVVVVRRRNESPLGPGAAATIHRTTLVQVAMGTKQLDFADDYLSL
jgi:hypothetical protein